MASSIYYINGKQQYNSDISFNNTNTQFISSQSVSINSPSIALTGNTTINGSAPITLSTDNVWTGKNYFPQDLSINNLFISSTANASSMNDKIVTIDASNRLIYVDLSSSSSTSVALGGHSMMNNKTANGSTAIGYDALRNISNEQSTIYNNTVIGASAMSGSTSDAITGTNNTAIGSNAMKNIIGGVGNVAIGSNALFTLTNGSSNTVIGAFSDVDNGLVTNNQILGTGNISAHSNVNIIGSGIEANGTNRTFINSVRNTTGHAASAISLYNPITNEMSYCNDMIQKSLNDAQFISQQALKLIAIDCLGPSNQGSSLAITSDGSTLAIGGTGDNGGLGAVWIWSKSGQTWTKQYKLVGTGSTGSTAINQGSSIAFSSDGNTIAIGGSGDNNGVGAVWIWTRQAYGEPYNQQQKVVGTGNTGSSNQGTSVALSGDGNILVFGGSGDNSNIGATWVWARSAFGQTYSQFQNKIVGTTNSAFGTSVAISTDGTTIAVGGTGDNSGVGATWIYTKVATTWTIQGSKLIGTSSSQTPINQGSSIAISSDGNTVAVGGSADNNNIGALWIFTRSGVVWTQQDNKLIGTNYVGSSIYQGSSVSMTSDGNTIVVGGKGDNGSNGAVWVWTRSSFGQSYYQQGPKIVGTGNIGIGGQLQGSSVLISSDGSSLVVGGSGDNSNIGSVWVYPKSVNNIYVGNNNQSMTIGSTTPSSQVTSQIVQITKLVAMDNCGNSQQGTSVVFSSDGLTMAVGSPADNGNKGSVWIWTRSGETWTKQQKIIGGTTGSYFGSSVAFSGTLDASGTSATLAVGGAGDSNGIGAVWIYTRTSFGASYLLQGSKIVPTDNASNASQIGSSVSLSSNGNRVAIGGPGYNSGAGATWIWNRVGLVWSQSGLRYVGSTASATPSYQGCSVALSGDGNTLVVGGYGDSNYYGAIWIFTWSGSVWSLLQSKFSGISSYTNCYQGDSVTISNDGSTIVFGAPSDINGAGSTWVLKRNGAFGQTYSQLNTQLIGTGGVGNGNQGQSVALSGDGLTLIVGAPYDNVNNGAVWVWNRDTSGNPFYQYGPKVVGTGNIGSSQVGWSVAISSDGSIMSSGGTYDNGVANVAGGIGAVWIFTKNTTNISITNMNQFIGIGTVTPTAPLTVSCNNYNGGTAAGSSCVDIYNYNIGGAFQRYFSNNQSNAWWHVGSEVGDGAQNFPFHIFNQAGTGVYINSGNQSWTGYSDRRLKTNIADIDISGAYHNILKLNPVTYKLLTDVNDSQMKQGLIAQDVLPIFPEIVSMNHGYYGIGYTELIPYLIAGMKQQAAIISQQQEENVSLKSAVAALDARLASLESKL